MRWGPKKGDFDGSRLAHCLFIAVIAFSALLSCSGLKLDSASNCLNEKSGCFRPDTTAPAFKQSIFPANGATVSQIEYVELRFSEELKDPKPSDFEISGPGKGSLYISSVEKTASYTYRLNMGSIGVGDGWIYIDFSKAKDYGGNTVAMPTQVSYYGNTQVQIQLTSQPAKMAISATGYNSSGMSFQFTHNYTDDSNNAWRACLTTGANSCPVGSPTVFASGTGLVSGTPQALSRAVGNFSPGINRLVVVVENIGKNKAGINSWEIFHDSSAPVSTFTPPEDPSASPLQVTFACSDNSEKIAYTTASQQSTAPADPPDPTFDANGDPVAPAILYTGAFMTPSTPDPYLTKYKIRCIDKAGNVEISNPPTTLLKLPLYTIDSSIPTVVVNLDSSYRDFISTGGFNSTTLRFTTNQASPSEYKIVHGATSCVAGDGTALVPMTALPVTADTLVQHTFDTTTHFTADQVYNVRICVRNVSLVWGSAYLQITRDSALPTTSASPAGGNFGADQFVALTCTDANPDKIAYTINSGATDPSFFANGDVNVGSTATGPITVSQGVTTIKYLCRDKAGNVEFPVKTQTYTIDKILPTITVVSNTHAALSTSGAQTSTTIAWTSSRPSAPYIVRLGGADCSLGTSYATGTTNADINIPMNTIVPVGALGADGPYTFRLCVENAIGTFGNTTVTIQKDSVAPNVPTPTATIAAVDATNFTLTWTAAVDDAPSSGIAGYRIYRSATSGSYPNYPATPTYTATSSPATISVPDTAPYHFRIVPFDAAGNLALLANAYQEITTKPTINLVVTGNTGNFSFTDGSQTPVSVAGSMAWTTNLSTGGTYNFAITTQPAGQTCSMRERPFGSLSSNVTVNIDCVNGQFVGGQYRSLAPSGLNYLLYRTNVQVKASGMTDANSLTVVGGFLYYGDYADCDGSTMGNQYCVYRLPVTSGGQTTFVTGLPNAVRGITNDGSNLYFVTEAPDNRLYKRPIATGAAIEIVSGLSNPYGIVTDGDAVFICNRGSNEIVRVALATGVKTTIASGLAGGPLGIAMTASDLYFTIWGSHAIYRVTKSGGAVTTVYGTAGVAGHQDNNGTAARFNQPHDLVYDGADNLFVADYSNHRVRKIRISTGRVITLAGDGTSAIFAGGTGPTVKIPLPVGITSDGASLYLGTHTDDRVSKLIDSGLVGYWPLNGNYEDHNSAGATANHLSTFGGNPTAQPGRWGEANGALQFNGSQNLNLNTVPTTATCDVTLAAWAKPTALNGSGSNIFTIGNSGGLGYSLFMGASGRLGMVLGGIYANGSEPSVPIFTTPTTWHHVALTCRATNQWTMYVDGRPVNTVTATANTTTGGEILIGGKGTQFFTGLIADARIYTRVLNEAEINELAQDAGGSGQVGTSYNNGPTELLAHYSFDQGYEDIAAGPVVGNLTFSGTKTAVLGKDGDTGGAIHYNGSTSYYYQNGTAGIAGLPSGDAPRTLCAWISPASYPSIGLKKLIMHYGDATATHAVDISLFNNGGTMNLSLSGYGGSSETWGSFKPPLNTWTHVCGVYSGGTAAEIYANGKSLTLSQSISTPWATTATTAQNFYIGRHLINGTDYFPGKIDDVRIYNKALTALEIRRIALQIPAGLVARYDLNDDIAGAKAVDTSGRGENLSISGATQVADRFGVPNEAYNFNGVSHSITGADAGLPTGSLSRMLCAWVRPTAYPAAVWGHFIKYGNSTVTGQMDALALKNNNQLTHSFYAMDHDLTYPIPLNAWTHICAAYNGSASLFYVNGGQVGGSALSPNTVLAGNSGLLIGNSGYDTAQRFTGDIDDVRIYNRVLNTNEMRALAGYHPVQVFNGFTAIKLHLDARAATYAAGGCNGGANCVSAWKDLTLAGNNLSQATASAQPIYDPAGINGKPALKFIGPSQTYLTGTCSIDLASQQMTVFAVLNETNQSGNDGIFQNGGPANGKLIYLLDGPARPALFDLQANQLNMEPAALFNNSTESVIMGLDYNFNGTTATGSFYKNGAAVTTNISNQTGSYNCGAGNLDIGRYFWGGGADYYDGFMGDFIYFNQVLGASDRNIVHCYLSGKYEMPLTGMTCP